MSWGLAGPRPSLTAQYPIPSSPKPEECIRVSGGFPKLGAFCGLGWYVGLSKVAVGTAAESFTVSGNSHCVSH